MRARQSITGPESFESPAVIRSGRERMYEWQRARRRRIEQPSAEQGAILLKELGRGFKFPPPNRARSAAVTRSRSGWVGKSRAKYLPKFVQ